MFGTQGVTQRTYGTGFAPPNGAGAAGKAAWGLDLSWRRFGEGRRLGGEGESSEVRQRPKGLALAAMVMVGLFSSVDCLDFCSTCIKLRMGDGPRLWMLLGF